MINARTIPQRMNQTTTQQYDEKSAVPPLDFIISLVADHRGTDPTELPELHRYLEGDLIDRFLRQPPAAGELRFRWDDVTVTLSADRTVEVTTLGGRELKTSSDEGHERPHSGMDREKGSEIRVTTE